MDRDMDKDTYMELYKDMDMSSNCEINNTSFIGFENSNDYDKKSELSCNRNDYNTQTFSAFKGNEKISQISFQSKNDSSKDEMTNPDQIYFINPSKNNNSTNLNINTEITLKSLDGDESKTNQLLEVKKELPPKFFPENSINAIIRNYYDISKELKLKLLLDMIQNNEIVQIKKVLESDTIKRRKACHNNNLYRTDHIFSKLINYINSSLLIFINNLIANLYTKEKMYQMLDGIIISNKITNKDLKEVFKKNDFKFRCKLDSKELKLNFLNLTLKKYFSVDISPKYKNTKYSSNYDELIIDIILNDEDNKNIFDFILNDLSIKDWIEIFLYKKDFKDFDKFNLFDKNQKNKIKENFGRIDKYINKIYQNDNKIYFHCFSLIAYNLYRFLLLKEKRNKTKNKEKKSEMKNK